MASAPMASISRLLQSGLARHLSPEEARAATAAPARSGFFHRKHS